MKLDFVITELEVGGAEKCLTSLAIHAKSNGYRVRVIALGCEPTDAQSQLVNQLRAASIQVHFLRGSKLWNSPWVFARLRKLVASEPPDLAQSFLFHANVASAIVYPAFSIPVLGGVRVAEPRRWRHHIAGWAASRMKKVVCVSQSVSRWCRRVEKVRQEKLIVIPNGVELSASTSRDFDTHPWIPDLPTRAPFLLFVGRMDYQKGVDQLMVRADGILKKLPGWHLVLIGEGPLLNEFRHNLPSMSEMARIHFLGWQANPRDWMAASQLLLLPTRFEGMPNVILEAMAEGRAIVATEAEGIQEIFGDSSQGQVCAAGDFDEWEKRVLELATEPQVRNRLGTLNRERVIVNYNLKDQLEAYLRLYSEHLCMLPGNHPSSPVE